MHEEDRAAALAMYERMFDEVEDEQSLSQALMSPTRQAVIIARAYDSRERKAALSTHPGIAVAGGEPVPAFMDVINSVELAAMKLRSSARVDENQYSLFGTVLNTDEAVERIASEVPAEKPVHVPEAAAAEVAADAVAVVKTAEEVAVPAPAEAEPVSAEPADKVDAFLAGFTFDENTISDETDEASEPASENAEAVAGEYTAAVQDAEEPEKAVAAAENKPETAPAVKKRKLRVLALLLFIPIAIVSVPLGTAVLLIPAAVSFALMFASVGSGIAIVSSLSAVNMMSDTLILAGLALIVFALGLLFMWLCLWIIFGPIVEHIIGVFRLGGKMCFKEVKK